MLTSFLPHPLILGKICIVSQLPHISFLPQQNNYRIILSRKMEVLVEPHKISQEILLKVAGGIISKYQVHEINNIFNFVQDSNQVIQEMKLYSQTLSQLYFEAGKQATQLFAYYHTQIFRIVDFLLKTVQKIYNKNQTHISPSTQSVHCSNCQHLIHQRNVRNMQREILDYHRYSAQMLDEDLKWELQQEYGKDQETTICSESYFRKKMFIIQKNIEDRQNNILECIEEFQQLRSNLVVEMQKRESVGDVNAFNMREYIQGVTQHFITTLRKIEVKINSLRRLNSVNEEKGVQTGSISEEAVKVVPVVDPLKMSMRFQSDFKKVSTLNNKLQESSKKVQNQINNLNAKVEALESQNKKLREEVFIQKMKNCKERAMKNAEKLQEKTKRQEVQKHKKSVLIDNLQSIFCESANFGSQFTTTLQQNFNCKDLSLCKQEDALPIIKNIFQKTLEKYTNQKSSMIVSLQKKRSIKDQVEVVELKRNKSRKKSLHMLQTQGKQTSRFSLKKTQKKEFQIFTAFSFKFGQKYQYSMSTISQPSFKNTQKDAAQPSNQNHKRKRLAKLSIFSDLKQHPQQPKPTTNQALKQRQKTDYSPQQLSEQYLASNLASSKVFKKSTFRRNKSQEDLTPTPKVQESFRVIRLKEKEIDVKVVRSFLLLNDQFGKVKEKQNRLHLGQRSRHVLEEQGDMKIQRQKIVLNLDELNYLTLLFSLFARVHLINVNVYTQIKEWILSSPKVKNLQDSSQSLIIRKIVSEIIYRHRQCTSNPAICPHLTDFLQAIQRFLTDSELDSVERAKNTLIQ